jgi:hypothetical protein
LQPQPSVRLLGEAMIGLCIAPVDPFESQDQQGYALLGPLANAHGLGIAIVSRDSGGLQVIQNDIRSGSMGWRPHSRARLGSFQVIAICALVCRVDSWRDIELFGKANEGNITHCPNIGLHILTAQNKPLAQCLRPDTKNLTRRVPQLEVPLLGSA